MDRSKATLYDDVKGNFANLFGKGQTMTVKTRLYRYRSAITGLFITAAEAAKNTATAIRERIR